MMKYQSILIDGNNLYERNYHVNKNLTFISEDGKELVTGGVYGFLRSIESLRKNYLADLGQIYILFDNCASKTRMRKEIDPEYKKYRKKKDKSFYKTVELLQQILLSYDEDFFIIYRTEYEADDLVKPVILSKISKYDRVLLVSDDLDWSRMLNYNNRPIDWLAGKEIYNEIDFQEKYRFKPTESNIIMWKMFRGDKSDNIPVGVSGIRKEIIFKLMEYKDIFDILFNINRISYLGQWKEKIIEAESRLKLNYQLVSFIGIGEEEIDDFMYKCEFRPKNLKIYYEALGFNIEKIDLRVFNYFENLKRFKEIKKDQDDFFKEPDLKRY